MAQKLFEISGEDWMKGISIQPYSMVGGIFQTATNFDPFEKIGLMLPSKDVTQYGSATIDKTVKYMTGFSESSLPYIYAYCGDVSATELYRVKLTDGTTTDVSAEISTTSSKARGAIIWKNAFVYAKNTSIRANAVPVASASDLEILTTNMVDGEHPFTVGADLNLYFPNSNSVGQITSIAGTAGNTATAFSLEAGMKVRHLVNDGRYLVIIADRNPDQSSVTQGSFDSMIGFWDYTSGTLTQRFDFLSAGLVGGVLKDGKIFVFGLDGIYVTNLVSYPRMIHSFRGNSNLTGKPSLPSHLGYSNGSIFWLDGSGISAYGSGIPGKGDIFFRPYLGSIVGTPTSLLFNGLTPWVGTHASADTTVKLYAFNNSTRASATISLAQINFEVPYIYEYSKVVLDRPLSSGQSVTLNVNAQQGDGNVSALSTFNTENKQSHIFDPLFTNATHKAYMEEISTLTLISNGGAVIEKFEVWGTPQHAKSSAI